MNNSLKIKTTIFLVVIVTFTFGQEKKNNQFNVFISAASSKIRNENYSKDQYLEIRYPACYNTGVAYTMYLNNHFAVTTGLEFSNYKNYFTCREYHQSSYTVKGPDGSDYYPITIADYSQKRTVHMMELPLLLRVESSPSMNKPNLFFEAGPKVCVEFSSKLESSGTITNQGIWSTNNSYWYYYTQNNPYYNLRSNDIIASNDYNFKKYNMALFFNAGFSIPISDNFNFNCSVYNTAGLKDINQTDKDVSYKNFLGEVSGYKPSKFSSSGFRIGVSIPVK